jgi:hypothetical protein
MRRPCAGRSVQTRRCTSNSTVDGLLCFEGQPGTVVLRDRPGLVAEYKRLSGRLVDMGQRNQAAKRLVQSAKRAFERG